MTEGIIHKYSEIPLCGRIYEDESRYGIKIFKYFNIDAGFLVVKYCQFCGAKLE